MLKAGEESRSYTRLRRQRTCYAALHLQQHILLRSDVQSPVSTGQCPVWPGNVQQWGGCRIGFNLIKCFDAWQHCGAALDIRSIRHPTHLLLIRIRIRLKIPIRSRLPESLKAAFWGQLMASDPLLLLRKQFALKGFRFAQLTVGKAFVRMRSFGRQTAIYPDPKTPDHIRQPTSHIDMPKTTGLCLLTNHSWH